MKEITINLEKLRKNKLFVATPLYGGMCHGGYTRSLCDLTVTAVRYGIEMKTYFISNESLVTRARNYCVDEFLRSGYTHMLFIDSDIEFNAQDVLVMMDFMTEESPYDVMGAPYPKKTIPYEKLVQAVNKGVADQNPNILEDFIGDFVFNFAMDPGQTTREIKLDEPAEVLETGTGFMMIKRSTFDNYLLSYPNIMYRPDHVRTEAFDGSREIGMYFQAEIDPISKRYLSEDYDFCQKVRKSGMKVWLCPWMHLKHTGSFVFGGKLAALASVGASPTADAALLQKTKGKQQK